MASTLRRQSREFALQLLFGSEFAKNESWESTLENFRSTFNPPAEAWDYTQILLAGVRAHRERIDEMIQKNLTHWRIQRLALVDLTLLRLATFEMKFSDGSVPSAVAINEAIDLAKRFGTSDSGKFVNGVLDQILRSEA